MDQITCTNCGATFEGDEFCPECGQWVDNAEEEFSLEEHAHDGDPVSSLPYTSVTCPSCGAGNPESNRHCEECGARLYQGDLPVAPQPLISMTAGIRAAIIIGSVIIGVILIAFIFNALRGDEEPPVTDSTLTTTTTLQRSLPELIPAALVSVECSTELSSFPCENLIDRTGAAWNDAGLEGIGATMTFTFNTPYQLEQIVISNLEDDTRFRRNFRINGLEIRADDMTDGTIETLVNRAGRHLINFTTLNTTQVVIEVRSTWPAEVVDGTSFTELAVEEIEFYGRPAG